MTMGKDYPHHVVIIGAGFGGLYAAYVAHFIQRWLEGKTLPPFHYRDKGSLAVIGRNAAVADLGRFHLSGFIAWLVWAFGHIRFLIEFENQLLVLLQWGWNYFTRKRGARLITGQGPVEV